MRWFRLLHPTEVAESAASIDFARLRSAGKTALLFDLDCTLEPGRPETLRAETVSFLKGLLEAGFRVGILSNRRFLSEERRGRLSVDGIPAIFHAGKPRRRGFLRMLDEFGAHTSDAVVVGDRRATDVLGANRLGIHSILVRRPLGRNTGRS